MAAPRTEAAIRRMREMISSGELKPGARLAPEGELAGQLGASRNTVREAVRALVTARVLDVRRGDGTYVTSLRPELLLHGMSSALELMQEGFALELVAVRRILEPPVAALAAVEADETAISTLGVLLTVVRNASSQSERVRADVAFHGLIASSCGNETLASILHATAAQTIKSLAQRAVLDRAADDRSAAQHEEIFYALASGDPDRAQAAALRHVASTEAWVRRSFAEGRIQAPAGSDEVRRSAGPRPPRKARVTGRGYHTGTERLN